jgi:hypothetical protein
MFDCLKTIARGLGFTNLSIAATGMGHSQALRNAAKDAGVENVVNSYVRVDRGMMKNRGKLNDTAYIDTARNHIRMLAKITGKQYFIVEWKLSSRSGGVNARMPLQRGSNRCIWQRIGNMVHSTLAQVVIPEFRITISAMNPSFERSSDRAIKRITVEYFFERSVPDMLAHLDLNFSFDTISRIPRWKSLGRGTAPSTMSCSTLISPQTQANFALSVTVRISGPATITARTWWQSIIKWNSSTFST